MLVSTPGVTHIACAFDHVIESFRNDLFPDYKTGDGVEAAMLAQFPLAERAVAALGIVVWPMVEFEADDALATAASCFRDQPGVEQVVICSPDKDLAQAVSGASVVCWDRRRDIVLSEDGVITTRGSSRSRARTIPSPQSRSTTPAASPSWTARRPPSSTSSTRSSPRTVSTRRWRWRRAPSTTSSSPD